MKHVVFAILIVGAFVLSGCSSKIPAQSNTYTDGLGLFSISYPSKYVITSEYMELMKQCSQEVDDCIKGRSSSTGAGFVFFAGIPYDTDLNPEVRVLVSDTPYAEERLEEWIDSLISSVFKYDAKEYQELSRTKVNVDGKKAIILEYQAKYKSGFESHFLNMYLIDNNLFWEVRCFVQPPKNYGDFEIDFNAIVRSLRILN